ncbi:hypothetical protein NEICINOT_05133 [Neisseria cinerea ATCC 14685]|uniref:Uncharacterized protein n=1 Tax=Neisseria cinerea ATCC 14685 TaxID=546262 RepID=D0W607_NEICI|nr:hypothetical protein NEICINOT_05133 [Neisseria cinerea ATCC 14685]
MKRRHSMPSETRRFKPLPVFQTAFARFPAAASSGTLPYKNRVGGGFPQHSSDFLQA